MSNPYANNIWSDWYVETPPYSPCLKPLAVLVASLAVIVPLFLVLSR